MSYATATSTEGKGGLPTRPADGSYQSGVSEMQMASSYSQKLKDPRWQKKRLEIMGRDGFRCRICGDDSNTLHVHHKHYFSKREPWDYEEQDLVTVCEICHDEAHSMGDELKAVAGHYDMDGPWSISALTALAAGFRDGMEEARGREAILSEKFNLSPDHYSLGLIAAMLSEPTEQDHKGHARMLVETMDIVRSYGSIWVLDALKKALASDLAGTHG